MAYGKKIPLSVGERAHIELPFSEVNMHMGIAGKIWPVELLENGMAQIYDGNSDNKFSFPVTANEAGIFRDGSGGFYCYGTYAQNAPAECEIEGCGKSVCECGSVYCHFHTHELPPPNVNVWGTRKSDINPDEFCQDCEHPIPGHYDNCPFHPRNREEDGAYPETDMPTFGTHSEPDSEW